MKILHTSDTHGSTKILRYLEKVAREENVDYIVISGDITPPLKKLFTQKISSVITMFLFVGWWSWTRRIGRMKKLNNSMLNTYVKYLAKIDSIGYPVLLIPGNEDHEPLFEMAHEKGNFKNLNNISNKTVKLKDGYRLTGYPDCNKQFFGRATSFREKDEHEIMIDLLSLINTKDNKKLIFMAHPPPYKFLDFAFKRNRGSKAVYVALEHFKPLLYLCGQIHENPGVEKVDGTIVVNSAVTVTLIELDKDGVKKIEQKFSTAPKRKENLVKVSF